MNDQGTPRVPVLRVMRIRSRRRLVLTLCAVFLAQTWMVYSDPAGRAAGPLSGLALEGRDVWHAHNCQSCHQIYGFGGFLGPDLTNFAGRVGAGEQGEAALRSRLESVLTAGSALMPAFRLGSEEREALAAYFAALDATGIGQVSRPDAASPREVLAGLVDALVAVDPPGEQAAAGFEIAADLGCIDCHLPNGSSTFRATDLTTLHDEVDRSRVEQTLAEGVPGRGMPAFALDDDQRAAVLAFLAYLARHGPAVRAGFERAERAARGALAALPWFEYR